MTVIALGLFMFFFLAVLISTLLAGIAGFCISALIVMILVMIGTDDGGTGPF